MSFFLIALGAAVTVGLLRSWTLALASPPPISLIPKGKPSRATATKARPTRAGWAAGTRSTA